EDAGGSAEHVNCESGVVGDREQPGGRRCGAGLQQSVALEGHRVLDHIGKIDAGRGDDLLGSETGYRCGEDPLQLGQLLRVVRGEDDPRPVRDRSVRSAHRCSARTSRWICASCAQPSVARSSSAPSSVRSKGAPSAVPCTSTKEPEPVTTTFMSVCAVTSSRYSRSSSGRPSTMPTLIALTESVRTCFAAGNAVCCLPHVIASASAT